MPKKSRSRSKTKPKKGRASKKKVKWRKPRQRPYKVSKVRHARRRHRKRHPKSRVSSRHAAIHKEAETANFLLHQMLKTINSTEDKPYNYHPRHHTRDPEYEGATDRLKEFKRGVPAPDVNLRRFPPYEMGPYTPAV